MQTMTDRSWLSGLIAAHHCRALDLLTIFQRGLYVHINIPGCINVNEQNNTRRNKTFLWSRIIFGVNYYHGGGCNLLRKMIQNLKTKQKDDSLSFQYHTVASSNMSAQHLFNSLQECTFAWLTIYHWL